MEQRKTFLKSCKGGSFFRFVNEGLKVMSTLESLEKGANPGTNDKSYDFAGSEITSGLSGAGDRVRIGVDDVGGRVSRDVLRQ